MGASVKIISLAPYEVARKKFPWAFYKVQAAPKDGYSKVTVTDGVASLYTGEGRWVSIAQQARAVAEDIIRGIEDHGVFIIEGDEPTKEELDAADKRRRQFYQKTIDEADASWRQFGNRSLIPSHAQFAADFLGVKKEWHTDLTELVECPGCLGRVMPGAARCPSCRAVLDFQKAFALMMLTPEEVKLAQEAGKLPKAETETKKVTAKSAVA